MITREARDGPLSGVLPMPANEKTNLPEYFAATETRLGLLAEAVKMLE